ncbi:zinc finger, RING/FYVE/PHD-type [Artemisia annua]|uniref:Zinc finger, RING/FYVE/PHD-type n=1 Tax=Artemisia annua TaxID=35608 RepID=A0A2U1KYX7_ARTAN|nr:zinc finger, RING/FYVE/PHD-type [Artemisia annua]
MEDPVNLKFKELSIHESIKEDEGVKDMELECEIKVKDDNYDYDYEGYCDLLFVSGSFCYLPCGHIFGLSCMKMFFQIEGRSFSQKCPTCRKSCTMKDVKLLYCTRLSRLRNVVADQKISTIRFPFTKKGSRAFELYVSRQQTDALKRQDDALKRLADVRGRHINLLKRCDDIALDGGQANALECQAEAVERVEALEKQAEALGRQTDAFKAKGEIDTDSDDYDFDVEDEIDGFDGLVDVSWCWRGDGSIWPICFEGWTSGGEHQMCCLPCGHIYGLSCINKWLQRFRGPGKCPQCKNLCTLKGVRVLYASRLCAADEELHERVRALEAKCADLEQKVAPLTPEELIDQICSNPTLVQRLAAALAELNQQQAVP